MKNMKRIGSKTKTLTWLLRFSGRALIVVLLAGTAFGQRTVTIDANSPQQTFEGWGTSLAWFANAVGGWEDPEREQALAALFDQKDGLGLTWVRYNIGGGDNPANPKPIIKPQNAIPGYVLRSGQYDWERDATQRWFVKRAQQLGVDQIEAIAYSPPWWMTISGTTQGAVGGGSNMKRPFFGKQPGSFADYLATVIEHFDKDWDIPIRNFDPLNEAAQFWWKAGDQKQEGCHFSEAEQERLIRDVGSLLSERGLRTTIAAADENNIDTAVGQFRDYSDGTKALITQIDVHGYAGTARTQLKELAARNRKRLTMSEWGSSKDTTGEDLAKHIQADVTGLGAVSWSIWQPVWPAIMKVNFAKHSFAVTQMYQVYANYTRFIRPNDQILATRDDSTLAAYNPNTRTLAIVEQNWSGADRQTHYNLSAFTTVGARVRAYRAVPGAALSEVEAPLLHEAILTAVAPAHSVTTYTIQGLVRYSPAHVIPVESTRAWRQVATMPTGVTSDAYNATYSFHFEGREARVFGKFGPDQGMAAISVDENPEADVELYSSEPKADAILFSTPLLPMGEHILTVRVMGFKHPASTGYAVTLSRLEALLVPASINDGNVGLGEGSFQFHGSWSYGTGAKDSFGGDSHTSDRAGDFYTISFRGKSVRVYSTLSRESGVAAFSVDGQPETQIDLYSPTTQEQSFVYASPELGTGVHVLKVRVTGERNASASDARVTADRVDVLP